jgi:hypothetical protein
MVLEQVDDMVDGGLGRSPEGHRARGRAAGVEPERHREAELQAARHPPPGPHDAPQRLEVGEETPLLVVEEARQRVRLDVELNPVQALPGVHAGVVVGDHLDEQRSQVAQRLLGPGRAAADRVHGQPVVPRRPVVVPGTGRGPAAATGEDGDHGGAGEDPRGPPHQLRQG